MRMQELKRITREYCRSLQKQIEANLKHFDKDWNGRHIRALAGMICDDQHESVRAARKEIGHSENYFAMSI